MYLQNFKYNVQRVCIFHLILDGILSILILAVKNGGGGGGGEGGGGGGGGGRKGEGRWRRAALWTKSIKRDKIYLLKILKKYVFSKSLIVMKRFKYLICVFVKHWKLNCQSKLDWKPGGKNYLATPS